MTFCSWLETRGEAGCWCSLTQSWTPYALSPNRKWCQGRPRISSFSGYLSVWRYGSQAAHEIGRDCRFEIAPGKPSWTYSSSSVSWSSLWAWLCFDALSWGSSRCATASSLCRSTSGLPLCLTFSATSVNSQSGSVPPWLPASPRPVCRSLRGS